MAEVTIGKYFVWSEAGRTSDDYQAIIGVQMGDQGETLRAVIRDKLFSSAAAAHLHSSDAIGWISEITDKALIVFKDGSSVQAT